MTIKHSETFTGALAVAVAINLFTGCKRLGKPPGIVVAD